MNYTTVKLTEDINYMIPAEKITPPANDFHCPICGAPVKRAIESDQDKSANPTCINEYYVHYASTVAKFVTPRTSPDNVRFAV